MSERDLAACLDRLATAVGVPRRPTAAQRHVARLQKAEDQPPVGMELQRATAALSARAAAAGTLPNFNAALDKLSPHANARDNFAVVLWKILEDPDLLAVLSSGDRAENRAISANQPKTAPNTDKHLQQQQLRGTPTGIGAGRRIQVPAHHRYAECEDGSVMESVSELNSLELNSPLDTIPRPSPLMSRQNSALVGGVPTNVMNNAIDNPMFTVSHAVDPGSPWVNTVPNAAEGQSVEVEARITLPDAGDLFSPIHAQLSSSAPEHIMQKFQEQPRYDGNLHLPCLTKDDILYPSQAKESLKDVHPVKQEMLLVNDLLDAFMDDGTSILELVPEQNEVGNTHYVYTLSQENSRCCPDALCEQLQNLLRIPESVLLVSRYITSRKLPEFGAVCGAFADAVRNLLMDWKLHVCTLEKDLQTSGEWNLIRLMSSCQQNIDSLYTTASLCAEAASHNAYGASLLNLLDSRAKTEAGNVSRTEVLRLLLKAASVPYFEVLTTWVSTGTLHDPCSEFMVVAVPGMNVDVELDGQSAFWVGGHKLRTVLADDGSEVSDVPTFLHAVEDEVLKAGKNWNILRQCQQQAASQGGGFADLEPSADQQTVEYDAAGRFVQQIQQHYERASTALLNMMLTHFQLKGWLASCKNFFLLHQGDYLTNFLDCAESELDKEVYKASMSLLRGQLEMAVKTSSLAHDIHSDKLQFILDPSSFTDLHTTLFHRKPKTNKNAKNIEKMKAADLIMLELSVQWPISIVMTPHNMRAFQFCFRHLVNVKVVERKLGDKWRQLMCTRKLKRPANDAERRGHALLWRLLALVNRMNTFIHRYLHFLTVEVIDPHWHEMMTKIDQASSIDEVIVLLSECLHKILEVGLLERLKTLSMVVIVLWKCRECCQRVDDAVKKYETQHLQEVPSEQRQKTLTPQMLLKVAMQPGFKESITMAEQGFTEAQTKLSKDLKTHKYSGIAGVNGANADSVADASKLLHQLLEVA